ncbi:phage portal protein [Xylophilus ampelinus]|uniref:Lambda family phage portal protein n=1 Tax=Xylophilus ampelinus TaxID=54067 RepID=A0A318SKQ8_9BURK|nr:phage portal protein [Xylophilus ampelinus]MCS4508898.1 phage portal protein [Xylophilus ampelinus]PYE79466.1 lambda family phage portal protein [Xylophilus ampelinus]
MVQQLNQQGVAMAAALAAGGGQNMLDRVIAYVAPQYAVQRLAARGALALSGGYTGARLDRAALSRYAPRAGGPASDIARDLPMLRARSRDQVRNAPVATGAVGSTVSHVVGTGLSFSPAIDAIRLGLDEDQAAEWQSDTQRKFGAWAISPDCATSRNLNFYGLQELAFRSALESGDVFATTPMPVRAGRRRLALQLIEADRVCNPHGAVNTDLLQDGVELAAETGEAMYVHIARRHPGDPAGIANAWDRMAVRGPSGRRNVIHLYKALRPGQVRGVPWLAPIIEPLKQLQRYSDAELQAAVVSGLFAVFIKMDPTAFGDLFDDDAQGVLADKAGKWSGEMEAGQVVNLLPGEEAMPVNPGRPNAQFDPFVQAILRQIGMALELPYEVLVMHFQSSYSAARGALLMAWKLFRSRRDWVATYFCQPVYETWLAHEVAEGRIAAPGFFADESVRAAWSLGTWVGDGPGSIDPTKEVAAAWDRVEMGISTLAAESVLHDGVEWEIKQRQRRREVDRQRRDGTFVSNKAASQVSTDLLDGIK